MDKYTVCKVDGFDIWVIRDNWPDGWDKKGVKIKRFYEQDEVIWKAKNRHEALEKCEELERQALRDEIRNLRHPYDDQL